MRILALKSIFLAKFMSEASLNQWINGRAEGDREKTREINSWEKKKLDILSSIRCDVFQVIICRSGWREKKFMA